MSTETVIVTRADVRDAVAARTSDRDDVLLDAVVAELQEKLGLVGEHPATTGLRSDMVGNWIDKQIDEQIGNDAFDKIVANNIDHK